MVVIFVNLIFKCSIAQRFARCKALNFFNCGSFAKYEISGAVIYCSKALSYDSFSSVIYQAYQPYFCLFKFEQLLFMLYLFVLYLLSEIAV